MSENNSIFLPVDLNIYALKYNKRSNILGKIKYKCSNFRDILYIKNIKMKIKIAMIFSDFKLLQNT